MRTSLALSLALLSCVAHAADGRELAADQGCYNCHGDPPRRNVPSFREIVARYAVYRGRLDTATEQELADNLHHGSLFAHVAAHERLSDAQARTLVRWLVDGAP